VDLREDMLREKFDLLIVRERVGRFGRNWIGMLLVMHEFGLQSCGLNRLEKARNSRFVLRCQNDELRGIQLCDRHEFCTVSQLYGEKLVCEV